jgi:hypothetical protein
VRGTEFEGVDCFGLDGARGELLACEAGGEGHGGCEGGRLESDEWDVQD